MLYILLQCVNELFDSKHPKFDLLDFKNKQFEPIHIFKYNNKYIQFKYLLYNYKNIFYFLSNQKTKCNQRVLILSSTKSDENKNI